MVKKRNNPFANEVIVELRMCQYDSIDEVPGIGDPSRIEWLEPDDLPVETRGNIFHANLPGDRIAMKLGGKMLIFANSMFSHLRKHVLAGDFRLHNA